MSSSSNTSTAYLRLGGWILAAFVALKFVSGYVATWSWWWLLFPTVPVLAEAFRGLKILVGR